jgi:hypothetical protein
MAVADPVLEREIRLRQMMAQLALDPLHFVQAAYPWKLPGSELEVYDGPDAWQAELLTEIGHQVRAHRFDGIHPVAPIRVAVSSGRGIGKGALTAWLVNWIMSTRRNAIGTVTANTNDQLQEKTWASIRVWTKRCITRQWFELNSTAMWRIGSREAWKCTPTSCAPENAEAFRGQHNATSTSFIIFDEASGIDDAIFAAAEGGLTDGEPMMFLFGNPTRNTGKFHRVIFGSERERWTTRVIDARTCRMPNQAFIQEWLEDHGEDSDYFRVEVRGLPPLADEYQYIDTARIAQAQTNVPYVVANEPLIAGVDVSGGGKSMTVCMFRQGFDARAIKPIILTGAQTVANDRQLVVDMLANALNEHPITAMFIDAAFGAPVAVRLKQLGFQNVHEVNFGGPSSDPRAENARAFMWKSLKEWLPKGAIDQHDHRLATELAGPGFHLTKSNKLVIEGKDSMTRRGIASPDRADALTLTFAMPVRLPYKKRARWQPMSPSPFA